MRVPCPSILGKPQNTPNASLFIPMVLFWPRGCVLDVKPQRNMSGRLPQIFGEKQTTFEPISGQTMVSWPTWKVSISLSHWVLQLSFLFHPISLSIEKVILIWILPSFRRPLRLSRHFSAKPRRVRRCARYHSLRLFENCFWITWFRWVLTKLWTFKVCLNFDRIQAFSFNWVRRPMSWTHVGLSSLEPFEPGPLGRAKPRALGPLSFLKPKPFYFYLFYFKLKPIRNPFIYLFHLFETKPFLN